MSRIAHVALGIALSLCLGCPQAGDQGTQKAVPNPGGGGVAGFVGSANKVKLKTGMMAVLNAANAYKGTHGEAPPDVDVLIAEGLLAESQAQDLWDNDYEIVAEGPSLSVVSYGADGAPGGEGANQDWSSDDLK